MDIHRVLSEIEAEVYEVYRYIHEKPELGLNEHNTGRFIKKEISEHRDCDDIKLIGPTGLLAVLNGEKKGPGHVLLLRADMDALPIREDNSHDPKSRNNGVMHACGHDAHTAILLGTLRTLKMYKKYFAGTIYFFFQPAEEILAGAKLLLETKEIDIGKIQGVAACHMIPDLYAGDIGLKQGAILAGADHFEIDVTGRGGHAAHPYTTVDPIVVSSEIIHQLQNLVSREVNALDSAVISVCSIHSDGNTFNIIPDHVNMNGTLRALNRDTRARLKSRITEVCKGIAEVNHAKADVKFHEGPPPFINDKDWVDRTVRVCEKLLGNGHIKMTDIATMGAEDFAFIKERYPGVFVRIGCRSRGKEFTPIHSGRFTVDRKALSVGILTLSGIALDFFGISEDKWLGKIPSED